MELKQQLRLSQQLVMTPQLQQAIKLLQLSRLELSDLIQQEIDENPVLDEAMETEKPDEPGMREPEAAVEEVPAPETPERPEIDWREYVDTSVSPGKGTYSYGGDREDIEPIITRKASFADHLLWQLHMQRFSPGELEVGEHIIGNIDRDGYLRISLEDVAAATGAGLETVKAMHTVIMHFDPVGVGARTLQECLLVQAEMLPGDAGIVKIILRDHMRDLERKKYPIIARSLKVSLSEVLAASEVIAHMEPRPGRGFYDNETQYITPDIYVYKIDGEFVVMLNEDGQPKLKVNHFYRNILAEKNAGSEKAKEYIQEKLRSAVWLIKSVYHRQTTIVNVMKSIIKFQHDFFELGPGNLKPLVLRDVAEDVSMHESNISRITTNKYVLTPHGIFELKYFFNSGLRSDSGDSIASESVKNKIMEILQHENHYKPCSDKDIAQALKAQGINIARRTVTKYREMLHVLSSSKRKKHR